MKRGDLQRPENVSGVSHTPISPLDPTPVSKISRLLLDKMLTNSKEYSARKQRTAAVRIGHEIQVIHVTIQRQSSGFTALQSYDDFRGWFRSIWRIMDYAGCDRCINYRYELRISWQRQCVIPTKVIRPTLNLFIATQYESIAIRSSFSGCQCSFQK